MSPMSDAKLAILGTGNIGGAIAHGVARAGRYKAEEIILTRRHAAALEPFAAAGFQTQSDNLDAVRRADTVILAVQPQQLDLLLSDVSPALDPSRHTLVSVVSGASCKSIRRDIEGLAVVRAMPNVAIAIGQSMTCLAGDRDPDALKTARSIFDTVGTCVTIDEDLMIPATALCACGVAFFLRAVRAAAQGGIEIGFHPEEALAMAAQTALGAAALTLEKGRHPERDSARHLRGPGYSGNRTGTQLDGCRLFPGGFADHGARVRCDLGTVL